MALASYEMAQLLAELPDLRPDPARWADIAHRFPTLARMESLRRLASGGRLSFDQWHQLGDNRRAALFGPCFSYGGDRGEFSGEQGGDFGSVSLKLPGLMNPTLACIPPPQPVPAFQPPPPAPAPPQPPGSPSPLSASPPPPPPPIFPPPQEPGIFDTIASWLREPEPVRGGEPLPELALPIPTPEGGLAMVRRRLPLGLVGPSFSPLLGGHDPMGIPTLTDATARMYHVLKDDAGDSFREPPPPPSVEEVTRALLADIARLLQEGWAMLRSGARAAAVDRENLLRAIASDFANPAEAKHAASSAAGALRTAAQAIDAGDPDQEAKLLAIQLMVARYMERATMRSSTSAAPGALSVDTFAEVEAQAVELVRAENVDTDTISQQLASAYDVLAEGAGLATRKAAEAAGALGRELTIPIALALLGLGVAAWLSR